MYSFEGDYRRKPQQNLSGASCQVDKTKFLRNAQMERMKREEQRNKYNARVKIQAFARSIRTRRAVHQYERQEFDKAQATVKNKNLSLDELLPFVRRLLFFYKESEDGPRLIWVLLHLIKLQRELQMKMFESNEWVWRMK